MACVSPRMENYISQEHISGDPKLAKEAMILKRETC